MHVYFLNLDHSWVDANRNWSFKQCTDGTAMFKGTPHAIFVGLVNQGCQILVKEVC